MCVFITAVPIIKLFAWGEGAGGGHVLRETASRGLCGLVCPSLTSERGGEGDCFYCVCYCSTNFITTSDPCQETVCVYLCVCLGFSRYCSTYFKTCVCLLLQYLL
jgi:hypothetical protein